MAIIQALLTLVSRSLGRVLSAVFGWAVVALFGETSGNQKMWLSGLVAAAAAWPLLLIGIAVPRIATLALAFVPIPKWVPSWTVRVAWIILALAVPVAIGLAMAIRPPVRQAPRVQRSLDDGTTRIGEGDAAERRDGRLMRTVRGFPITIGVAGAFLLVFITVPALRVMAFIRSRIDLHIPLVTDAGSYELVADEVERTLDRNGFDMTRVPAPWWIWSTTNGKSFTGKHYNSAAP